MSEPSGSPADGFAPERTISCTPSSSQRRTTWSNRSTMRAMPVRGRSMSLPPPLNDRWVGFSASAGSSCCSTIGWMSLPRMARFAYWIGSPAASAHPCAARSAHPRTVPSGSSSPTPSVNESPMATKRTDAMRRAYGSDRGPGQRPAALLAQVERRDDGHREEAREHHEQQGHSPDAEQGRHRERGEDRRDSADSCGPSRPVARRDVG